MPHQARRISESGYYHIVPKGINGQDIFERDEDRRLYLTLLAKAAKEAGVVIIAYCLMSNHVHIVLNDPQRHMSAFVKYVHERYGTIYCKQYGREGGVFSKKFWGEPIEKDSHLLCAVRYVHANPASAGICKAAAYEWSSAKEYLGRKGICDTSMVLDMCGGVEGFIRFSQPANATFLPFPGSKFSRHIRDDEARVIATDILGYSPSQLASKQRDERDGGIVLLRDRGFPAALITRLTGIGKHVVLHAT